MSNNILFAYLVFLAGLTLVSSTAVNAKNKPFDKEVYKSAIVKSDFEKTADLLASHFRAQGISISQNLKWHKTSPFALYNYYNERYYKPGITVSDFPTKSQVEEYWNTWSKHLTKAKWKPNTFFRNKKEAFELAHYNVLMLMSHELGHHLAHRQRVKNENLNCNEYIADMASMSIVSTFSEKSKLSKLQVRYLELLTSINNSIDESIRFEVVPSDIHRNCSCIPVVYPADSSQMAQYASAYFVRRTMLAQNSRLTTSKHIVDSIFKIHQLSWEDKFPRITTSLTNIEHNLDPMRMSATGAYMYEIYGLDRWRYGLDKIHDIQQVGFTDSGELQFVQMAWPSRMIKGSLQNVQILDKNGNYYFTWHYYPETTEVITKFRFMGFSGSDLRKDFAFLTAEKDSSGDSRLCVYKQSSGYYLKKHTLNIQSAQFVKGDCQLISCDNQHVTFLSNADNQITRTDYSLSTGFYHTDTLFRFNYSIDGNNDFVRRLLATQSANHIAFYTDYHILLWDGKSISTIVGNGIEGSNIQNGITELEKVQALYLKDNSLKVYDESFTPKLERNPVRLLHYNVDIPVKN